MKAKILCYVILCTAPFFLFAQTVDFSRTLRVGMRGDDVSALQKILNANAETRVATSGAGSPGNETDYFGPATMRALVKFQEKYRGEILAPAGLTSGTGIFGANTRAKARALKNSSRAQISPQVLKGDVVVMFPSQYSGKPGTTITISGAGFTATDNTIYFGNEHAVEKASSWNAQAITFKVPAIPKGNYPLFVKNARGESNKDSFFVVTDGVTPEPKIESVDPARVSRGGLVTIKGSGFVTNGNTIRAGTNVTENISSKDGTSLSFNIPLNILTATTSPSMKKVSFPLWVYVVNENGVSNGKNILLEL